MVAIREYLVLVGQVRAAAVNKVDAGEIASRRDLLGAQVFFDGHRVIGAAFDGRVIANDHDLRARHSADTCDHARARRRPVVHAMCRSGADFQEWRSHIKKVGHTVARQHFTT